MVPPSARSSATLCRSVSRSRTVCTARCPPLSACDEAWALAGRHGQDQGRTYPMAGATPHFIVFANEKGGTGKSTTAVHTAVALSAGGRRVAAIDLDTRQRTLGRYLDNRAETIKRTGIALPMPRYETFD